MRWQRGRTFGTKKQPPVEHPRPETAAGIFPLPPLPLNRETGRQSGPQGGFVPVFAAALPVEEC